MAWQPHPPKVCFFLLANCFLTNYPPARKRALCSFSGCLFSFWLPPRPPPNVFLATTTYRHPPATTTQPRNEPNCSFLGVATSFWPTPPINTHQLPPPNPETSLTARFQGCHVFSATITHRHPPATTAQPRNKPNCLFSGLPRLYGHNHSSTPTSHHLSIPTSHHDPTSKTSEALVFGVVTFLWSPPPPSTLKTSTCCSFSGLPPLSGCYPQKWAQALVFGV